LIGSEGGPSDRFVDINTLFPLVAHKDHHVAPSQFISRGKKMRVRWDEAEQRDVLTEN
jgi:hypothetical protein